MTEKDLKRIVICKIHYMAKAILRTAVYEGGRSGVTDISLSVAGLEAEYEYFDKEFLYRERLQIIAKMREDPKLSMYLEKDDEFGNGPIDFIFSKVRADVDRIDIRLNKAIIGLKFWMVPVDDATETLNKAGLVFGSWYDTENPEAIDILEKMFGIAREEASGDPVNHPQHYISGGIEVIDVIEAFCKDLSGSEAVCTANVIKYICRWNNKNGLEDLKKARWYLERLIKTLEMKGEK